MPSRLQARTRSKPTGVRPGPMSGELGKAKGTPWPKMLGRAPDQAKAAKTLVVKVFKLDQIGPDGLGTFDVKKHEKGSIHASLLHLGGSGGNSDRVVRSCNESSKSGKLPGGLALRVGGIKRDSHGDGVACVGCGEIILHGMFGWNPHGEEATHHASLLCSWQIEVTLVVAGQEVDSIFPDVFTDLMDCVVVAIEDLDLVHILWLQSANDGSNQKLKRNGEVADRNTISI